jgi:hypothetical protein
MQKIKNAEDLKNIIRELEYKQAEEWPLLKDQFLSTCKSLKPINLIKSTVKEIISEPDLKMDLINTVIGFTIGAFAKKKLVGKTHNPLTQLLGTILEVGVSGIVAKNAEGIKSIAMDIFKKLVNQFGNPKEE